MKSRLLSLIAALAIVFGANAQNLSVSNMETAAGWSETLTINIEGASEMTALQCVLTLPQGIELAQKTSDNYGIELGSATDGNATNGHYVTSSLLESGDLLIVVYSMDLRTFKDGTLLYVPVVATDDFTATANGNLRIVHTSTVEAESNVCNDVVFTARLYGEPEPETTYYWYVGVTDPRTLTPDNVGNEILDQWTEFTTEKESPVSVSKQDPEYNAHVWYVAAPYDWKYTLYNATGAASSEAAYKMYSAMIDGVRYKVWEGKGEAWQAVGQLTIANHVPITALSVEQSSITMTVGDVATVNVTKTPEDATVPNWQIAWTSSNEDVVFVSGGELHACAPGTAIITITDTDFYGNGASVSFEVIVEAAAESEPEGLSTSKYYRVKNVMTGLYLQVEGNNTNMKLQNKAEGLAMMQIFGLEDAEEGMYYIKAADADNRYYAHASGWNFNATTNADNKTPFTIAPVEGETNVYTLHQSVSSYAGLAGADASAAGSVIYCNKGIGNNGKWTFEALTAEEQATYVVTLTAAVKSALEATIAHAEGVVVNRSAVLSAEDVAAINTAVATAKAEKDNTADVDVLNALADAINAAVSEAIYVWSIDELSNAVCYAVSTEERGAWYSLSENLTSTTKAGIAADATDSKQQFAFVKSAKTGAYYLYSVSEEKFVKVDGQYTALTEAPVQTISFLNGTRSAKFPWVVALNAEDGQKQMGISNGYDPAIITFYNDLGDGGNTVRIEKVAAFDATAALALIDALETGVEPSTLNSQLSTEVYDLMGRRVAQPQKGGVYIVNGKKVVW